MSAIYAPTPPALRGRAWTGLITLLLVVPGCSGGDGSPGPEQLYLNALHSTSRGPTILDDATSQPQTTGF